MVVTGYCNSKRKCHGHSRKSILLVTFLRKSKYKILILNLEKTLGKLFFEVNSFFVQFISSHCSQLATPFHQKPIFSSSMYTETCTNINIQDQFFPIVAPSYTTCLVRTKQSLYSVFFNCFCKVHSGQLMTPSSSGHCKLYLLWVCKLQYQFIQYQHD